MIAKYKIPNTKYLLVAIAIVMASAMLCFAQDDPVRLLATVDKEEIKIGDRVKLDVFVEGASGYDVFFPETLDNAGEFALIGSSPLKSGWGRSIRQGREYVMSIYTTGTHVIPPVQVGYKKPEDIEWKTVNTPQFPIEVKSVLTKINSDIMEIKGLLGLSGGFPWVAFILGIVLAGALISWVLWRRALAAAEADREEPRLPHEVAYEQLRLLKAKDLPGQGLVKEYYTELSDIIRRYLEGRFSFRAPVMTTEEFMESIKRSALLTREHKDILGGFLSHCDMVKFARYGPSELEMMDSYRSAEQLVDQTREEEEEDEEE